MSTPEWSVLETYRSQSEARVVESFLRAQGFEVQLLDALGQVAARGIGEMRMMIRTEELDRARQALLEAQRSTHLSVVDENAKPPRVFGGRNDLIVITMFLALLLLALASVRWLR